jgi:acyl-CoA synthetase (AMP-forming)/AMP-acid ligase II
MIVVGVACIVSSWNLTPNDVCLNMMPLFHIGGIMRNILSPILSGGCVIACSGFDPLLFWDVLTSPSPASRGQQGPGPEQEEKNVKLLRATWYYAAPTMHHAILMEAERRPLPLPVASVRFVRASNTTMHFTN